MFLKKIKSILAYSLLLAMLLSILPPVSLAAEGETRWNPIDLANITANDTIAITMNTSKGLFALPTGETSSKGQPVAKAVSMDGTQLLTTGDSSAFGWTISFSESGYSIKHDSEYLYIIKDNNGVRIGNTEKFWSLEDNYLTAPDPSGVTRYLGVYNGTDWRCYTSINSNIAGQTLQFWILDNPTTDPTDPTETTAPACDHTNATSEVTTPATCTDDGVRTYTCECGETWTEAIDATGHSYTNGVCETCGAEESDVAVYEKATSIQIGDVIFLVYETDSIELNGFSTTSTIYGLGESYSGTIAARYPLEVVQGNSDNTFAFHKDGSYLCWKSGNSLSTSTEITANSSWTVTFDDNGNAVITNVADTTRVIFWNATSPRFACYAKDGQKAIQIYKLVPDEEEPETPTEPCEHQWDNDVQTTDPTCTEEGVKTFTCTLCGHEETETIPSKGHSMDEGTVTTEPTCTENGVKTFTCTACGHEETETIPSKGHSVDEGTVTTEPTCTENGVKTFTCTACGHEETEAIPAAGHNMVDGSCTACGYTKPVLTAGQYVIAANVNGTYYAMGNTFGKKIDGTAVTITDVKIWEDNAEAFVITLAEADGGWTIQSPDGSYLKYVSSTDVGKSGDPYIWTITEGTNGTWRVSAQTAGRALAFRAGTYNTFRGYAVSNITATGTEYYDVELIPVIAAPDAGLLYHSISLNGNIAVNFYMTLSDKVAADPDAYMLFKQEGVEGEVKTYIKDCVEKQVRGKDAYIFTYEVAAKAMTDTITAQFFYGDTSTEEYTYSVKTYADNQRENMSDNESLMNLLEAMLRYGAASQIQFDYHTERLADAGLEPVDYSDVTIDGYPLNLPQGTDLVTFAGATLLLKSETTLRYFLRVDPSVENLTVTYNGIPLEILTRSGLHYVDVKNISAPALDMEFTITVNDGVQEANITYSPLTYCQSIRSKDNTDAHKDVCAALYLYNQAANDFFKTAE